MKNLLKIIVLLCLASVLVSCSGQTVGTSTNQGDKVLYLVAGLDDAAENTDVLFTVGFDFTKNHVNIAQIPRDTYFGFGNGQNKINQYFATKRSEGLNENMAMERTLEAISDSFGAKFDGYIAIDIKTFSEMVDVIGGVDIELRDEMIIDFDNEEPIILHKGINHIDSAVAERFVRYRKGYATQDLGRMDAQKIFLNALFWKISSGLSLPSMISLAGKLQKGAFTNIKLRELVPLLWKSMISGGDSGSSFVTLPGEPVVSESGLSYYVLNKKSCSDIAKKYMFATDDFDRKHMFLNTNSEIFVNVYEDNSINSREFTNESVKDITLKK